jgi:hypothetical protein
MMMAHQKKIQTVTKKHNKMRNIIIILLLAFTSVAQCQTANIITETEYDNIKINGIRLVDIKDTHGVESEMETLFDIPISKEINQDGYFSRYYYDGFRISFSSILSGALEHILGSFHITNNNSNITIQGITFTIGDNISVLGDVVFRTTIYGDRFITYTFCDGCNNYIAIKFDQITNIITEIYYVELT